MSTQPPAPTRDELDTAPAADARPALAFTDAAGAKRWIREVPLTNIPAAARVVLGQLRALAQTEMAPRERASIADVLRDQVAYLHTELARRYAGRPQPPEGRTKEAADLAIALWQELWGQYSACLKPLLDGEPELAGVKSKLLQRGLYVGKQLVLVHGLARRTAPPELWHELHAYYRLAEMLECAVTAVSDHLLPTAPGVSCYSTYSHALLLGLADPCALSVKQIELTDRWLTTWARKLFPYAQQRETEGPLITVDLDGTTGAQVGAFAPQDPPPSTRFGYPGKLATSVRGRLKRLQVGATPAELQLGHDCSADQCTMLLGYLDAHWYQAPRHSDHREAKTVELCAGGLPAAYARTGGRLLERRDEPGRMTFDDVQRLQATNVVARREGSHALGRAFPGSSAAWEPWSGHWEPREATLVRGGEARHSWQLDQLALVRDKSDVRAACVTRVALAPDEGLALTLRWWAGAPKPLALRPHSMASLGEAPIPALLLADSPEDKACLVLPPRTFSPSRVLCAGEGSGARRFRLTRLLQRGTDFERVAYFEEVA
jgi:hypothetical protein